MGNPTTPVFSLKVGGTPATANLFKNSPNGVEAAFNVILNCRENVFDKVSVTAITLQDQHADTSLIENNSIANSKYGIRGVSNTLSFVRIANNTIVADASSEGMGIRVSGFNTRRIPGTGGYEIASNTVDVSGVGIFAQTVGELEISGNTVDIRGQFNMINTGAGIMVVGTDDALVIENDLRGHAVLGDSIDGIRMEMSGNSRVRCNEISHFRTCLRFWSTSLGARVFFNDFHDGWYGLVLENGGNIGQQGNFQQPTGNSWLPTFPNSSWVCGSSPGDRRMVDTIRVNNPALFFARNTPIQNPNAVQNCNGGQLGGAIPIQITTGIQGNNCSTSGTGGGDDGGFLQAIAGKSTSYPIYPSESQYLSEQLALAMMESDSSLCMGDSLLMACHTQLQASLKANILEAEDRMLQQQFVQAGLANAYNPGNLLETNHQEVTNLILKLETMGYLSEVEGLQLHMIAKQCPLSGGKAVYQARSAMAKIDQEMEYDNAACEGKDMKKVSIINTEAEDVHRINMYPNPAGDQVTISSSEPVSIKIHDLSGKQLGRILHPGGEVMLPVHDFPRGMVIVEYLFSDGETGALKLVLH
jgi:hypothetical protein